LSIGTNDYRWFSSNRNYFWHQVAIFHFIFFELVILAVLAVFVSLSPGQFLQVFRMVTKGPLPSSFLASGSTR